jgi:hypothetical protein
MSDIEIKPSVEVNNDEPPEPERRKLTWHATRNHGAFLLIAALMLFLIFGIHAINQFLLVGSVDWTYMALYGMSVLFVSVAGFSIYDCTFVAYEDVLTNFYPKKEDKN